MRFAVRYVTLAMLALWVSSLLLVLGGSLAEHVLDKLDLLAYACGATSLVGLFVMKFVGPPPRAFVVRAALVLLMLLVTGLSAPLRTSTTAVALNAVLGLVLLSWYARE